MLPSYLYLHLQYLPPNLFTQHGQSFLLSCFSHLTYPSAVSFIVFTCFMIPSQPLSFRVHVDHVPVSYPHPSSLLCKHSLNSYSQLLLFFGLLDLSCTIMLPVRLADNQYNYFASYAAL